MKLQLDVATAADLIGVETRSTSLFLRGEPLKIRSAIYALGDRINILKVQMCWSYRNKFHNAQWPCLTNTFTFV